MNDNVRLLKDDYMNRLTSVERINMITDPDSFKEFNKDINFYDPIEFRGYKEKVEREQNKTGLNEAVVTGVCTISGNACALIIMDSHFMMGSMGSVVGEKVCRAFETAVKKKLALIAFTASGGARMQEGPLSLMQMIKTASAVKKHSIKGLLYISVITDPTTGGVSASFASLADIIIAEPHATYGFTGKRIIRESIQKELPEDFQTAESALKNGAIDMIVKRDQLKLVLAGLLKLHRRRRHGYP